MKKDYFFLCGLPRSGSTLLGSLLNQNKDIGVYPNSILPDIINELNKLKFHPIVQNFPNTTYSKYFK
jgi:LPS sulfotransferase NodH